ncbi:hypothetical protein PAXRUDRAFT_586015 [Paxillus rubicundulus Ve08.2h10]|uniref:Unplaced genomic scaffold scaffold_475, whole genome shotgun sequence n=1 Tax=Paxillus rubicundulus Ve08.2h10 TaxID=930991 RepID=A0A0D0DZ91_9AGAM|nr:hypothetical protein PAXRUDRAFT_586015 [Paxillus rubicundulus Ve08.2h10]
MKTNTLVPDKGEAITQRSAILCVIRPRSHDTTLSIRPVERDAACIVVYESQVVTMCDIPWQRMKWQTCLGFDIIESPTQDQY